MRRNGSAGAGTSASPSSAGPRASRALGCGARDGRTPTGSEAASSCRHTGADTGDDTADDAGDDTVDDTEGDAGDDTEDDTGDDTEDDTAGDTGDDAGDDAGAGIAGLGGATRASSTKSARTTPATNGNDGDQEPARSAAAQVRAIAAGSPGRTASCHAITSAAQTCSVLASLWRTFALTAPRTSSRVS